MAEDKLLGDYLKDSTSGDYGEEFDAEDFAEALEEPKSAYEAARRMDTKPKGEMKLPERGALEAFGRSGLESATMGASDIIGAGIAAGTEYLSAPEKSMVDPLETYYEAKESIKKAREEAAEKHPGSAIAGTLAGGFATASAVPTLPGKLGYYAMKTKQAKEIARAAELKKKLGLFRKARQAGTMNAIKDAAVSGAVYGAGYGALGGGAKTFKGDVKGTAKDIVSGATIGGGLGAGVGGAVEFLPRLGEGLPIIGELIKSFKYGAKGQMVAGKEAAELLDDKLKVLAEKVNREINKNIRTLAKKKNLAYDELTEAGYKLNFKDELDEMEALVRKLPAHTDDQIKDKERLLSEISNFQGINKEMQKAQKQLTTKRAKALDANLRKQPFLTAENKADKAALKYQAKNPDADLIDTRYMKHADDKGNELLIRQDTYSVRKIDEAGEEFEEEFVKEFVADMTPAAPGKAATGYQPATQMKVMGAKDKISGKVDSVPITGEKRMYPEKLDPEQARSLEQSLTAMTAIGDRSLQTPAARQAAQGLKKQLQQKIAKDYENKLGSAVLKDVNKMLHAVGTGKELLGLPRTAIKSEVKDAVNKLAEEFKKLPNVSGSQFKKNYEDAMEEIAKVDPKFADKIYKQIADIAEQHKLAHKTMGVEFGEHGMSSIAGGKFSGIPIWLGNIVGGVPGVAMKGTAAMTKGMMKMAPEQLRTLAERLIANGQQRWGDTILKALEKEKSTKAIVYGLLKRPEFRRAVRELEEEPSKKDK